MNALHITLSALAVWRITHLLQTEDGPVKVFARCRNYLRSVSVGRASLAGLADCFYCLSLWMAAPFALSLGTNWKERTTLWLALSAAAILINRLIEMAPTSFYEEPYLEEKPQCLAVEMHDDRPRILKPTRAQFE